IPHVLWAHHTMIKSSNGDTQFLLTYGTKAVIPTEIGMPTLRTAEIDMVQNDEALEIIDLLEGRREQAAIRKARSKAKMEKYYNSKVRNTSFRSGDLVYRNNDASHAKDSEKLSPRWEGPYEVIETLVERANKSLGEGIKARLDERSKDWIEEIPHVLWAHHTMIKSSNGDTQFLLTYGTKAVIPTEIGMPTLRTAEIDMVQNDEALEIIDLLEGRREQAAIRKARSKAKMEKYYNSK
nr:reverse transcriptase domain-containing protein [Tanacetum cinerariifolium]